MPLQGAGVGTVGGVRHGEFEHPRLVEVYDAECVWGPEDELFLALVAEAPVGAPTESAAEGTVDRAGATRGKGVLDLGCGTGRFTLALAEAGHRVTGVDPARASLDAARAKPGAERVTWIEGTSAAIPSGPFDVAVLTSHVAQFVVTDEGWAAVLDDLYRVLVPGGRLLFDSRDPHDRRWERWNPVDSRRRIDLPDGTVVAMETEVTDLHPNGAAGLDAPTVDFTIHYAFADGERLASTAALRFRTEDEVRTSLDAAGFTVDTIHGGWHREPLGTGTDGEQVVVATRRRGGRLTARRQAPDERGDLPSVGGRGA